MAAERSSDARDIAREAARLAREAARTARAEATEEARRIRREARRLGSEAARQGRGQARETVEPPADGPSSHRALDVEGVREVLVKQTAGRLTIRPCREGETPGVEISGSKSPPELSVTRDGDRLVVDVRLSLGRLFRRRRGVDTLVRLSPGFTRLDVNMAHGHLVIDDLTCDELAVDVGAGEVFLHTVRADTTIHLGAGHVVTEDHRGLVACDCGTGDVRIEVSEAKPGDYAIEVGIGQAELVLPPGLSVNPSISSGLGKSESTYPDAGEGAEITARLSTGIGRAAIIPGDTTPKATRTGEATRKPAASRRTESEEVRVLQLLEQGRITPQEAADLIAALQGATRPGDASAFD